MRNVILPIQWLRGIAALMVVWFHACQGLGITGVAALPFGASGVDIFFVISGFIMVAISAGGARTPGEFFRDRLTRVAPLYWLVTLVIVVAVVLPLHLFKSLEPTAMNVVRSLLFIPHYSQRWADQISPVLPPGWTLNFEMFFYLLFAISLMFKSRSTIALVVLCGLLVSGGFLLGPFGSAPLRTYTDPMLLEFVAGALIGEAYLRGFVIKPWWLGLLVAAFGLMLLAEGAQFESSAGRIAQGTGAILVVAACVRPDVRRDRALLHALGDASYSIYLTHFLTLMVLLKLTSLVWPGAHGPFENAVLALLSILVSVMTGWVVFRWIERPLTKWVRSWAHGARGFTRRSESGAMIE